ncbi:hypothetical protein AT251_18975 [Enterovibrio nigricans]|nr:hypothetical protein [Enterovibrio nigricans]PKF49425.1 hypothetical protein AT251_18975 [Enterovibrio nigricans]
MSYCKLNGDWSPAIAFSNLSKAAGTGELDDFFLSYYPPKDAILAIFYSVSNDSAVAYGPNEDDGDGDEGTTNVLGSWAGGFISNTMSFSDATTEYDKNSISLFSYFFHNLNTTSSPNKIVRYINSVQFSADHDKNETVTNCDPDWLKVTPQTSTTSVENTILPPVLDFSSSASINVSDNPVEPTITPASSESDDKSGDVYDVTSSGVTTEYAVNRCTSTATIEIKSFNIDRTQEPSQFTSYASHDYAFHGGDTNCTLEFEQSGQTVPVTSVSMNFVVYRQSSRVTKTKTMYVYRVGEGQSNTDKDLSLVWSQNVTPDGNGNLKFHLTDESPYMVDLGSNKLKCEYTVCVTDDLAHNHQKDLFLPCKFEVQTKPYAPAFEVGFGDDKQQIESGPANTHNVTLKQTNALSKDSEVGDISIALSVHPTSHGVSSNTWSQPWTMSYSGFVTYKNTDYRWTTANTPEPEYTSLDAGTQKDLTYSQQVEIPPSGCQTNQTLEVRQWAPHLESAPIVYSVTFAATATSTEEDVEINPADYFQILTSSNQACYLEATSKPKRIRLNTLFANELIRRANSSLDNLLCWDAQLLPEPQLGQGTYVDIVLDAYDDNIHGENLFYKLYNSNVYKDGDKFLIHSGQLDEQSSITVRVFLPRVTNAYGNKDHIYMRAEYQSGLTDQIRFVRADTSDPHGWAIDDTYNEGTFSGLTSATALKVDSEPMDFCGANGLYFWELFYYTPMLVAERLLQTQNFEDTEHWLKYVFSPGGNVEGDDVSPSYVERQWNVRPLEEDTAWDETQTDSTDPDIVAQGDPMHYKVSTYMKLLDLLIARGDAAYRMLEQDTLSEAKMWYVTALNLLGDEPDIPLCSDWGEPSLAYAVQQLPLNEQALESLAIKGFAATVQSAGTANSLLSIFLPEENAKLAGYWTTLNQRLYNLRHNLTIDGQPLNLPLYATPADPKALQNAAAVGGGASSSLSAGAISIQRFPVMLDSARLLVNQLSQYGSNLLSAIERKDGEALNMLMQTQALDLMQLNINLQDKSIEQLKAEQDSLTVSLSRAQASLDTYQAWLNEGVSRTEQSAMDARIAAGSLTAQANIFRTSGAGLDMAPNIFGMAVGGIQLGAMANASGYCLDATASANTTAAEAKETSEQYRRRAQEWESARDDAQLAVNEIEAQQNALQVQLEASEMQKSILVTQQRQLQAQQDFLKNKYSNQALYSWLQGRLSSLFYQFYDLTVSRCLKAQAGYQWETQDSSTFIQPGAWDDSHAGLLCGETLLLNLTRMESSYLAWDKRALEVNRTVSLADEMAKELAGDDSYTNFNAAVQAAIDEGTKTGTTFSVSLDSESLLATINLSSLELEKDYPTNLGSVRRIKQVSVSLPALLGPYQDIQAVLSYSGNGNGIHQSCRQAQFLTALMTAGSSSWTLTTAAICRLKGCLLQVMRRIAV